MSVFDSWSDARADAQAKANAHKRDMGLRRVREYGETRYVVQHLPAVDKRYGTDATCEVVAPVRAIERVPEHLRCAAYSLDGRDD